VVGNCLWQELHEAVATYDSALAEVASLVPKDDLAELRSFNRPPGLVQVPNPNPEHSTLKPSALSCARCILLREVFHSS